jgi:hypothetical protein
VRSLPFFNPNKCEMRIKEWREAMTLSANQMILIE